MKRSPLPPRTTRLRRRGRPKYRSYVPDRAFQRWVRGQGCLIHDSRCSAVWQVAPILGAGGHDQGNVCCLCSKHHAEQRRIGIESFEAKYRVNLRATAERLWAEFVTERGSE